MGGTDRYFLTKGRAVFQSWLCQDHTPKKAEKEDPGFKDWDMPFVFEALARAHAVNGNKEECKKFKDKAQKLTDKLESEDDKKMCQGEIDKIQC